MREAQGSPCVASMPCALFFSSSSSGEKRGIIEFTKAGKKNSEKTCVAPSRESLEEEEDEEQGEERRATSHISKKLAEAPRKHGVARPEGNLLARYNAL